MARPQRAPVQGAGNRASQSFSSFHSTAAKRTDTDGSSFFAVWETEEWLQTYTKPVGDAGGDKGKAHSAKENNEMEE